MICPKCGNNLPEGTTFCTSCGTSLVAPAPEQKKGGFTGAKLIALILTLVSIAALVISYFGVMGTSFEKIPAVALIMGDDVKEAKELKKQMKEAYDQAKDIFDEAEDEMDKKDAKVAKKALKVIKALGSSLSINNMQDLLDCAKDLEDIEVDGQSIISRSVIDDADEVSEVLSIISTVVLIFMLVCLAFTALGGFLRINGLVIAGLVFSVLYALIFCGFLYLVVFAAADVALCIFNSKSKKQVVTIQ